MIVLWTFGQNTEWSVNEWDAISPRSQQKHARIFLGWGVCGCAGGAGWQVGGSPGGWDPKWGSHNLFRLVTAG
eukprot:scaffold15300_cov23-Cyclotella_meneghiniana.AAC.4